MVTPYYQDEAVKIYHGDCLDVLPYIDSVDHVITDPPYGRETHEGARTGSGDRALVDFDCIDAESLRHVFAECKAARWLIATIEWQHAAILERIPPSGWEFIRLGVWVKPNGAPQFTGDRPSTGWEAVCILHSPGKKRWNNGGHHAVWTFNKQNGTHPTQKPLALIKQFVLEFTDRCEFILDPFMGSGTTLRAAKDLGRKAIGIEIEERYCEIAAKRMAQGVLDFEK